MKKNWKNARSKWMKIWYKKALTSLIRKTTSSSKHKRDIVCSDGKFRSRAHTGIAWRVLCLVLYVMSRQKKKSWGYGIRPARRRRRDSRMKRDLELWVVFMKTKQLVAIIHFLWIPHSPLSLSCLLPPHPDTVWHSLFCYRKSNILKFSRYNYFMAYNWPCICYVAVRLSSIFEIFVELNCSWLAWDWLLIAHYLNHFFTMLDAYKADKLMRSSRDRLNKAIHNKIQLFSMSLVIIIITITMIMSSTLSQFHYSNVEHSLIAGAAIEHR